MLSLALSLRLKIDFPALHLPVWKVTTQSPSQWRFGERAVVEVNVGEELGQLEWVEMPGGSGSVAGAGRCNESQSGAVAALAGRTGTADLAAAEHAALPTILAPQALENRRLK